MRRRLAVLVGTVATVLAVSLTGAPAGGAASVPGRGPDAGTGPPNVVLVLLDDMRLDDAHWMRRTRERVAETGATYANYYAPMSLCCPSRTSILRGQYPHNTGVLTNAEPDGGFAGSRAVDTSTLATWLDDTYATGFVGKYLNGYEGPDQTYVPPGWDDWMATIATYGYLGIVTNDNGVPVDHSGVNSPQVFAQQASEFVTEQSALGASFFLQVSLVTPHNGGPRRDGAGDVPTPFVPARDRGDYHGPSTPPGPAYDEADVSDKTGPVASLPPLTEAERAATVVAMTQRRESLRSADRAVGQLLDTLEVTGELDDTYVVVTSDNGYMLGEQRILDGKRQPYEPASHMPLFVSGPGIPAGRVWEGVAGTQDIAPTVLDIAGLQPPGWLDGHSVLPTADRADGDLDRALLLEGAQVPVDPENGGDTVYAARRTVAETGWVYRALVSRRWKLVEWERTGTSELYDLEADPQEVQNLSGDSAAKAVLADMSQRLDRLWLCAAAGCE